MSKPAIIPVSVAEEEDITHRQQWDYSGYDDGVQRRPSRKGKERELPEPTSPWSNNSRASSPIDSRPDEALQPERTSSYPPVTDEEEESRRIQENLKRWEQAELQRRKAARQSSVSSTSGGSVSIVENVTRRASLLWPGNRGSRDQRRHTHGRGTGSLASSSMGLGQHVQLPSTDNLPLTAIAPPTADSPTVPENGDDYDTDTTSIHTITEADVRASAAKGKGQEQEPLDDPFNPPEAHEQQRVNEMLSPFSDPPEHQTSALVGGEMVSVSESGSAYPIVVITSSTKPPPPRPLGLPPPKAPPPPIDSPSPTDARGTGGAAQDDDEEGGEKKTWWWHEWLCGCGEGPDRGGDRQAGKTNPYE